MWTAVLRRQTVGNFVQGGRADALSQPPFVDSGSLDGGNKSKKRRAADP